MIKDSKIENLEKFVLKVQIQGEQAKLHLTSHIHLLYLSSFLFSPCGTYNV